MAVVRTKDSRIPKAYKLILDDGQIVNVMACRGGQTVGSERSLIQTQREFTVIQQRIEHLTKEAVVAPDDKTYTSKLNYVKKFERDFANLEPQVDRTLLSVLTEWDLALTEDSERDADYIPLTTDGMATVERDMKFDIFSKLMEKFSEENEEKKESSANTPAGTQVKVNSVSTPPGQSTTSLQSSTE